MNAPVAATEDLIYSVEDGIARLTFNRPQARNALTFAMYEQMAVICETVNNDRSIKAMILTGAGDKAFASGTDISQFRAFKTAQDALDYEARIDRVLGALEACRVPTIAAIAGACTGGGAGIAACCDIRIGACAFWCRVSGGSRPWSTSSASRTFGRAFACCKTPPSRRPRSANMAQKQRMRRSMSPPSHTARLRICTECTASQVSTAVRRVR